MAPRTVHVDDYDRETHRGRFRTVTIAISVAFFLLAVRLAVLQLVRGERYEKMSRAQKLRTVTLEPIRGDIYDRNGEPMAVTRQGFHLLLYGNPSESKVTDLAGSISELLEIPREKIELKFEKRRNIAPFQPMVLLENLTREQVAALEENLAHLGCLEVASVPERYYPRGESASHLIGYLGEVTGKELGREGNEEYAPGDLIGRMGVEQAFEDLLRGKNGRQKVVVDSTGRRNELFEHELNLPPPQKQQPGKNIELTVDLRLQRACEKALGASAGAAVVMNVYTGEILAMASTPGFNPNHVMSGLDAQEWKQLSSDPRRPFFYRPVQGEYPPGSVFKVVVAAAALQEGVIKPDDTVECKGVVQLGANRDEYHCWKDEGHGTVDFYRGLVESCDIYYYRLGELLGIDKIRDYAYRFGLGRVSGLGLPGEKSGLVPGPVWKRRSRGKSWYLGDTVITAIGQGYTLVTPLQVTLMMSVIANGGKLMEPQLVYRVLNRDGSVLRGFAPKVDVPDVVSPDVCRRVKEALVGVVHDPHGTGAGSMGTLPVRVAGKTGTAQVISRSRKEMFMEREGEVPWKYRDHAWFTAFAPADDPEIAVTVLVEHGGGGSAAAAPVCGEIIRYYFHNLYKQARR